MNGFDALRLGLIGAIVMAVLLLLVRFMAPFRFAILAFLLVTLIAYAGWRIWQYWLARRAAKAFARTRRGEIQQQLKHSRKALRAHEDAIKNLLTSQDELRKSGAAVSKDSSQAKARTTDLLAAYAHEINLRQQKVAFYTQTITQLEKLADHHQWLETLQAKEAELDHYRQQHAGEVADMESLRWTLEREATWLDNLDQLNDRLEATDSLESVAAMRESLKELLV